MTVQQALQRGIALLTEAGQESARLDAQILLGHVLGVERTRLYAYPETGITSKEERQFFALIGRRARGEPVAYLLGHEEFYGRDFLVDRRVLIPRPETELLVEAALRACRERLDGGQMPVVADIGTGSGAIAITLAAEEPRLPYLYATDISRDALEVAELNCQRHSVEQRVRLLPGDLLTPLPEPVDVFIANLPYVGTQEMEILDTDVRDYEPHLALFSGTEGLDTIRRLFLQARESRVVREGAVFLLEIGYRQREALTEMVHETWPQADVTFTKDYAGWDRLLQVRV